MIQRSFIFYGKPTGRVPGIEASKRATLEFTGEVNSVLDLAKSLDLVAIWAWISRPTTPLHSSALQTRAKFHNSVLYKLHPNRFTNLLSAAIVCCSRQKLIDRLMEQLLRVLCILTRAKTHRENGKVRRKVVVTIIWCRQLEKGAWHVYVSSSWQQRHALLLSPWEPWTLV
jgi:hypothetical protein